MENNGASMNEIASAYQKHLKELAFLNTNPSYSDYQERFANADDLMSKERFLFVKKNYLSDATENFNGITQPVLILLGEEDRNVNVQNTYAVLKKIISSKTNLSLYIIPNATHTLLKHPKYNSQKPGPLYFIKLMIDGEKAYSTAYFMHLTEWLSILPFICYYQA
jgi:esterase/lipase